MNSVHILTKCFFRPVLISSYPFTPRAVTWLRRLVAGLSLGIGDSDTFQCILCGIYGEQIGTRTFFFFHSIPLKFCWHILSSTRIISRWGLFPTARSHSRYSEQVLRFMSVHTHTYIYIYIYNKLYNTLNNIFVLFMLFLWLRSVHSIIVVYSEECSVLNHMASHPIT